MTQPIYTAVNPVNSLVAGWQVRRQDAGDISQSVLAQGLTSDEAAACVAALTALEAARTHDLADLGRRAMIDRRVARLHGELRRQIDQCRRDDELNPLLGLSGLPLADATALVESVEAGEERSLVDLARTCRAMGWRVDAFYAALNLRSGDYPGLVAANRGVYLDIRPTEWTS